MIQQPRFDPTNRSFEARLEMSNQAEQLSEIGSRPQQNTNSFTYQGATQSDANHGLGEGEESMSAAIG